MYYSSEMEWNPKWGWENLDMFNSKGTESLKKLQLTDWEVEDEGEIDGGSYKMSASRCGSGSGGSDSELVHGYSMRSSISASTESSPYEVMKASHFGHEAYVSSPGTIIKSETEHYMADASGLSSSPLENSFVSVEPLLGLKLGKRTYFENNSNTSNINISPASVIPVSSTAGKKTKASFQNGIIPRCQVQGCNLDLSSAKEYHRKHRVCDTHSKSPRVIVGGMELRFCQQCSRFHSLTDFDEKKRSCRRRLSDHNARRRKPKQETLQFHSRKLSAQLYDGMQQMNFALEGNAAGGSNLENFYSPKFTVDKSFPWMFEKAGQPSMQNVDLPRVKIVRSNSANHPSANNGNSTHVFNQGSKEAMLTFNSNAAEQEFPRALSLLSTKPWGSTEAECIMSDQHHRLLHPVTTTTTTTTDPLLPPPPPPPIPQGIPIPLVSSDFWQVQQQSSNGFQLHNFSDYCNTTGSHFGQAQQHFRS